MLRNSMIQIGEAANTYNPALNLLTQKGYSIRAVILDDENFIWEATYRNIKVSAHDPLTLLGLANLAETYGEQWQKYSNNLYDQFLDKALEK